MDFPPGLKRHAAMVILRHDQEFMLLERANPPNQGLYVPVGGKLDPYESPDAAARRETYEETGLVVGPLRFCGVLSETSPTAYNWMCHIYLADIPKVSPPACDEGLLRWIPFAEVATLPTPPTDWWIYQFAMEEQPFVLNALYDASLRLLTMTEEITGRDLETNGMQARL